MTNTVSLSVTRFYYDGDPLRFAARAGGTRVKKVEPKGGTTITTAYAGAIEVTITPTQRITQVYYLAGAQRMATRVITSTGSVVYYVHADHLGSASLTTNASGNKLGELRYYPYGAPRYVWGATPTDRRFTGQRSEEASLGSLYDYGARMYSPTTYSTAWDAAALAGLPTVAIGVVDLTGSLLKGGGPTIQGSLPANDRVVIGKQADLSRPGAMRPGERLLDLPDQGSPKQNWKQNWGSLREAMRAGNPIRDASNPDKWNGPLRLVGGEVDMSTYGGFLRAERAGLMDSGWKYDRNTGYWYPPE